MWLRTTAVLGEYAAAVDRGLQVPSYKMLVEAAFIPAYWNSNQLVDRADAPLGRSAAPSAATQFTVAEYNFGLFWGFRTWRMSRPWCLMIHGPTSSSMGTQRHSPMRSNGGYGYFRGVLRSAQTATPAQDSCSII